MDRAKAFFGLKVIALATTDLANLKIGSRICGWARADDNLYESVACLDDHGGGAMNITLRRRVQSCSSDH